jgi:hypothetical protein
MSLTPLDRLMGIQIRFSRWMPKGLAAGFDKDGNLVRVFRLDEPAPPPGAAPPERPR